jgi:hypothetical protein
MIYAYYGSWAILAEIQALALQIFSLPSSVPVGTQQRPDAVLVHIGIFVFNRSVQAPLARTRSISAHISHRFLSHRFSKKQAVLMAWLLVVCCFRKIGVAY